MDSGLVGAIKIKDGLFIGDEFAAQDLEFVVANKVTHIVNCAGRQVPNHWEPIGVRYVTFLWLDQDGQVQIDPRDEVFRDVFAFIEKASAAGESVLIHSVRDLSKPIVLISSYLMRKYRWAMFKSLEFLSSRAPALHLSPTFIHQLANFEGRLAKAGFAAKSTDWTTTTFEDEEEMVLQNTLLNARQAQTPLVSGPVPGMKRTDRIRWRDGGSGEPTKLTTANPAVSNPVDNGFVVLKSAMKGAGRDVTRVPIRSSQGRRLGKLKLDYLSDNSRFAKTIETALEYSTSTKAATEPAALRARPAELLSPVAPKEISEPLIRGKKIRAASADHKDVELPLTTVKRPLKLPISDDFVSVSELKLKDTPAAVQRPVRPLPTSKSMGLLTKVKRPVTAPSKRPPSPTPKAGDARPRALGQSRTVGKLPTRWHM